MFKTDLKLNGFKSSLVLIRYRISHWMYQHAGGTVYICDLFFRYASSNFTSFKDIFLIHIGD